MDNDSESGSNDPRESLGAELTGALSPSYGEQVERFLDNQGLSPFSPNFQFNRLKYKWYARIRQTFSGTNE